MLKDGNTNKEINNEFDYINSMMGLIKPENLKPNRTGVATYANYNYMFNFDIKNPNKPLPILIGKHTMLKGGLVELVWMMTGRTDNKFLRDNGVNYWTPWQNEDGEFGPIYGHQMRNFNGKDQLVDVIRSLKNNFGSRRHIISLWNPSDLEKMALPPCHFIYHFTTYVDNNTQKKMMNVHTTMRSLDSLLGLPYDLLLSLYMTKIIGFVCEIDSDSLFLNAADYHLYENHIGNLSKYDDEYTKNANDGDKPPTQIDFKQFVYDSFKFERPGIDEFLNFIILNNFDVFEFKSENGEIWKQNENIKRIGGKIAV